MRVTMQRFAPFVDARVCSLTVAVFVADSTPDIRRKKYSRQSRTGKRSSEMRGEFQKAGFADQRSGEAIPRALSRLQAERSEGLF
jgi:hypothetical protein